MTPPPVGAESSVKLLAIADMGQAEVRQSACICLLPKMLLYRTQLVPDLLSADGNSGAVSHLASNVSLCHLYKLQILKA